MIPRTVLNDIGVFNTQPEFQAVEDYHLWLRIAYRYPIYFVPQVLALYRVHAGNISGDIPIMVDRSQAVLEDIFGQLPVSERLKRKALARIDINRFKHRVRCGLPEAEAVACLQNALRDDPNDLSARTYFALIRCMGFSVFQKGARLFHQYLNQAWRA